MPKLENMVLARPCPIDLPAMGAERTRWCDHCGQTVHNLSAGSREDAEALLAAAHGEVCVSYLRRPDGPVLFDLARAATIMSAALLAACLPRGGKPPVALAEYAASASVPASVGVARDFAGLVAEGEPRPDPALPPGALLLVALDDSGLFVPGAMVSIVPAETRHPKMADALVSGLTDDEGRVVFLDLPPGQYVALAARSFELKGEVAVTMSGAGVRGGVVLAFGDANLEVGGI